MPRDTRTFDSVDRAIRVLTALDEYGDVEEVEVGVEVSDLDVWRLLEAAMEPEESDFDPATVKGAGELMEDGDDGDELAPNQEPAEQPKQSRNDTSNMGVKYVEMGSRKKQVLAFMRNHEGEWVDTRDFAPEVEPDLPEDANARSIASSALNKVERRDWLDQLKTRYITDDDRIRRKQYAYDPEDVLEEPTEEEVSEEESEEESEDEESEWESVDSIGLVPENTNISRTLRTLVEMTNGNARGGAYTVREVADQADDIGMIQVQPAFTKLFERGTVARKQIPKEHGGRKYVYTPTEHGVKQVEKFQQEA